MGTYIQAAQVGELSENSSKLIEVNNAEIALVHSGGSYYAISNACTHVGGPLCEGLISGDTIACPWHGARFDFKPGKANSGPTRGDLKCYAVRVINDRIEIEL